MRLAHLALIFVLLIACINAESLEDKVKRLEQKIFQLETQLDTCTRQQVSSCDAVKDVNPTAASGTYHIDFDGPQGAEPATVTCNFEQQTTSFGESIKRTVDHCSSKGCYDLVTSYENKDQLDILLEQSDFCQQEINQISVNKRSNSTASRLR